MGKRVEIEWRGVDHRLTVISVLAWFVRYALLTTLLTAVISGLASTAFASRASAAAQGCPETAPGAVSSGSPGAQQQLVPAGAVSLTLCRYRGLSDPNPSYVNQLVGSATLTDPQQLQLSADQFNALPPFPNGVFACPLDDGSSLLASFEYANSPPDEVSIRSTGCSSATNGYVTSSMMFSGGQELRTELQNLTGCASSIDYWLCNSDPVTPNPNPGVSTSNPNPAPSTQPPARDASVSGFVRVCRGPAPGRRCFVEKIRICRPPHGCMASDRIAIIDQAGRRVLVRTLRRSRFRLSLSPGRYTIELLGDGKQIHGHVMRRKKVTAAAGRTTKVVFQLAVP